MKNMQIGEVLVALGYITYEQLEETLFYQKYYGGLLGEILIKKDYISQDDWTKFIKSSGVIKLGEKLIEERLITVYQLRHALNYQKMYGGRLGNILVELAYISTQSLKDIVTQEETRLLLGEILYKKALITEKQLEDALMLQKQSGGRLGDILIFLNYSTEEILCRAVALQNQIGMVGEYFEPPTAHKLSYEMCLEYQIMLLYEKNTHYCTAVKEILNDVQVKEVESSLNKPIEQVLATAKEMNKLWEKSYGPHQLKQSIYELYDTDPDNSAYETLNKKQNILLILLGICLMIFLLINYEKTLFIMVIFIQLIYMFMTALKLYIVKKGANKEAQLRFLDEEIAHIDERKLPVYTLLIPVYKEAAVIKSLIEHIAKIDYPQYKLDVCILLEEDDRETLGVIKEISLPSNYTVMIVPTYEPKTKPKACNYGLIRSKGEYVVIYDAEDRPEPDQLKKAYFAFQKLPKEYVCVQSKLNYYNSNQNLLTKWFTHEYSMWFELLLVGIMQMDVPIPLGGTSNHFKVNFLKEVGAWDPFNVTEDADLGVRLFKKGYKTAVIDSRTWEEANSKCDNWLRQRSRWIKGYMQTWLVHMRHPRKLFRSLGLKGFIGYQVMILGTPLLPILNPIFWGLLILWILTQASWIRPLFSGVIYYIATIELVFGNFMFVYTNLIGTYWVVRDCEGKNKRPFSYDIIKYALLTPLYWVMMSIAAYKALVQLIVKPFYWEKTHHGLTEEIRENEKIIK